ncbi:integrase catalytic domain-containing protein [Pelagibacterium mangrovi]|uniref:integrase catalytic domain-containing protein n=1 Tax=Pelagibacterium mangrovi TaxID=3119828 RepID=UPI002FC903D7
MTFDAMTLPKLDFDLRKDDLYWVKTSPDEKRALRFLRMDMKGLLVFQGDDGPDIKIAVPLFKTMRSDGRAARVPNKVRTKKSPLELGDVNPTNLLDPEEPGITTTEQARRLKQIRIFQKARDLRWFVVEADLAPLTTRGHVGVDRFISSKRADAKRAGIRWTPSAPTLLRAIDQCGEFQSRPLSAFFYDYGKHEKLRRWHPFVISEAQKMIEAFWHPDRKPHHEVRNDFYNAILNEIARLKGEGLAIPPSLRKPAKETTRQWINLAESWYRWRDRYGQPAADARYLGRGRSIEATRPLEYVVFDHTVVDCWALVEDEGGNILLVEKPTLTLAVDLKTRMRLAAFLSYEPPSLYSVMACLKQVVRVKDWLVEEFGAVKGACDGWGKPRTIVVDNGWEFAGMSFQATCEAAGISVIWAPVRCPQFKAVVEQAFDDLNEHVWHRMKGGIPLTPQLRSKFRIDNSTKAAHTIRQMEYLMWHHFVHVRHLEPNEEIGCAPALAWAKGLQAHGRRTVDDVTVFDGLLGEGVRCTLTPQGVAIDGQRFHDPSITSDLLNRLLRFARKGNRTKDFARAGSMDVYATRDRVDASYVMVWDFEAKKSIRMPNVRSRYSHGISWKVLKEVERFAAEENLAFHSEDEMIAARAAFNAMVRSELPHQGFRAARKRAALIDKAPSLVPGDRVKEVAIPANPTGAVNIAHDTAAVHRTDDRIPPAGPDRSRQKRKKTSKGTQGARTRDALLSGTQPPDTEVTVMEPSAFALDDPASFLRHLAQTDED